MQDSVCCNDDLFFEMSHISEVGTLALDKKKQKQRAEQHESRLNWLWGEPPPYVPSAEDQASLLQRLYYGWVGEYMAKALREELNGKTLPPPMHDLRSYETGLKLSREMQLQLRSLHRWDPFVGSAVRYRGQPSTSGRLCWVGYVRQSDAPRSLVAGVEWDVPPRHRVTAPPGSSASLHDGVVHGERLFGPTRPDCSSCEPITMVELLAADAPPTPQAPSILRALLKVLAYHVWIQLPNRILSDLCSAALPVLLERYVGYLESDQATWVQGIFLVVAVFLLSAVQSCAAHKYDHMSIRAASIFENAALATMFEKCFTISEKSLCNPEMSVGRIINMVGTDVENIGDLNWYIVYFVSAPLLLVICVALLYRLVGWCALAGISVLFITFPIQGVFTAWQSSIREKMATVVDARLKATNELFSGIRIVKYMGWEPRFLAQIEQAREQEIVYLKKIQYTYVMFTLLDGATPILVIAMVFLLYYASGHQLTPTVVFPTIALLNTLRVPFFMIPVIISALLQCLVSSRRVTLFLECNDSYSDVKNITKIFTAGAAAAFDDAVVSVFRPHRLPLCRPRISGVVGDIRRRLKRRRVPESEWIVKNQQEVDKHHNADVDIPQTTNQEDGSFYQLLPKILLRNVNVVIPDGKLTVVLGPTGSGKSTLLATLLGEFEVTRGGVWAARSIAYVPQQPWIMNATVRDNVLFFAPCDAARLDEAVRACQLEPDLQLLAAGLETEIGEKGINLSGGQKARVSLARAVYADRELYLLDDPLSALDAHVGERIVRDVLDGVLRHKTRVLATHQLHVLPKADYVVLMDAGAVRFAGDRADFMRSGAYAELVAHEAHENGGGDNGESGADAVDLIDGGGRNGGGGASLPVSTPTSAGGGGGAAVAELKEATGSGKGAKLITTEEKAVGTVPWETYLEYFRTCGGVHVAVLVLVVFFLTELMMLSTNVWLSMWSTNRFSLTVATYLKVYITLVLVGTVTTPLRFSMAYNAMRRGSRGLHQLILRSVSVATMEFFDTTPLGRIVNRFSRDIDRVDNEMPLSMIFLLQTCFGIVSSVGVSIASLPYVAIMIIPCGFMYYRLILLYNASNREIRRVGSTLKAPMLSLVGEILAGSSTITAFGRAPSIMAEALKRIDLVYSSSAIENLANRWLGVRVEFLSNAVVTSIALVGVVGTMTHLGSHDIALVSLSLTMALTCTSQLNWLVRQVGTVEADMNSVERLLYYTRDIEHEEMPELSELVEEIAQKRRSTEGGNATAAVVIEGSVNGRSHTGSNGHSKSAARPAVVAGWLEFRDVQLRYRAGLPLVLRGVSFRIEPREKVGIVGRTGSGKSTLLLTFMRMVDISGGEIVVTGRPIRSYGLRELRRLFSMIPQDPVLFDGTLRSNLDPFLEATAAELWRALELVGMRERVEAESAGLDAHVMEGGSNFSVGQRQLLCLARAIVKRGSGFILMDEATANIDHALDRQIQKTVMTAFDSHTVITIAHRLHTVALYNKIIVMDHGVVAEVGTPRQLSSNPSTIFNLMVRALGGDGEAEFRSLVATRGI